MRMSDGFGRLVLVAPPMDATLYFQLVDAIASVRAPRDLAALSDRVALTAMHPLERRVLERALRARSEALDLTEAMLFHARKAADLAPAREAPWPAAK